MSEHRKSLTRTLSNVAYLIDMIKAAPDIMEKRAERIKKEVRRGTYDSKSRIAKVVEKLLKREYV